MTRRTTFHRDQRGATAAEFALVLPIFLLFLLGLIDVGRYAWAINEAEKATQIGARWAVVTDLVPSGLKDYSFAVSEEIPQGTPVPTSAFGGVSCESTQSTATTPGAVSCTCIDGGACGWPADVDEDAFRRIVSRMRLIYPAIGDGDVTVDYLNSGLGYSGDPNGSDVAPLVTVRLGTTANPLGFPMFFMLGQRVSLPNFSYALTLEDAEGTIAN